MKIRSLSGEFSGDFALYNANMLKYESLHNHTTLSDGKLSHLEVLDTAEKAGFGVMAFTDHDALPGKGILRQLRNYDGPVKWLIGCEISSGLPKELGGGPTGMFHILGLFTDPTNEPLLEHCDKALAARVERMEKMVQNIQGLGLKLSADDCLRESGGESVGRPHIAAAIVSRPENVWTLHALKDDMAAVAHNDPDLAEKYDEMVRRAEVRGDVQLPFDLFLSEDAFIPDVYVEYSYWTDMDDSVRLIREAGGVAILAHWPTIKHKIPLEILASFLQDKRLDGIELRSGFLGPEVDEEYRMLLNLADETGCLATIGIDAHQARDILEFDKETGAGKDTIGQTIRIVEKINPELTNSNLLR